jgi:NAD(P)-dependent dehydrogenase (short-subunit alcohol dehydrogenase family)
MALRALVVGGTGGIGYAMACRIAAEAPPSSTIIISGRTKPEKLPHANMVFRPLDASSMAAIKQYTDQYKAETGADNKLDMLVLTQGIATTAGRTETPEGIDRKMALHYYGRQLLVRELEPALKDDARVVIVLDSTRGGPDKVNMADLDLKTTYGLSSAAAHCISMTDAMVQHYAAAAAAAGTKRSYIHAYPGFVNTNILKGLPWYLRPAAKGLGAVMGTSPDTCAERMVKGSEASSAKAVADGRLYGYIDDKGKEVAGRPVWSDEQRNKVVEHTWKIVDEALQKGATA